MRKYTWCYVSNYCHVCNIAVGGFSFNAEEMKPNTSQNLNGQELN